MAALAHEISKGSLRSYYRTRLNERLKSSETKSVWDRQICSNLTEILKGCGPQVGLFRSIQGEPDLFSLAQSFPHKVFCFPRVQNSDLQFFKYSSASQWQVGAWDIPELNADTSSEVDIHDLDVVVIPGLAFDIEGHRLGRGKGFYDRALKGYRGIKVGVGYSFQMSPQPLPFEEHDVVMSQVVTEEKMIVVKG